MRGSKPLLTVSTTDISDFTLQRMYTLPTIHISLDAHVCKALKQFQVSGRDSLRGLYKNSLTYDNLLRFQVKAVITLPNEIVP
jgi:hypothetical protein